MLLAMDTINNYHKKLLFKLNARNMAVLVQIAMEQKLSVSKGKMKVTTKSDRP
mgnify:CR=1 FL=1